MRRFFINPAEPDQQKVFLDQEESHHLVRVLRLPVGAQVELFDGAGTRYLGTIEKLGKEVRVSLLSRQRLEIERTGSVIVCQGDLKGGKMDFLVEKCTELGVVQFVPFTAGRSQGRADPERLVRRQQRRCAIVKTACKQCGRLHFMQVDQEMEFGDLLSLDLDPLCRKIILWEKAEGVRLMEVIGDDFHNQVCLMVGPEGGFSDQEAAQAKSAGWLPVSLGNRILRAETAAISAVAVVNHLLGRM